MKINEIITEATYGIDTRYSDEDLAALFNAAEEVAEFAHDKLGIDIVITSHFKDRIREKRNLGTPRFNKITPLDIKNAFVKILRKGLKFFKDKEISTNYVFFDPDTFMNIPLIKKAETRYVVPTVLKGDKYFGRDQKITL